jgi:hypothetical protein
MKRSTVLALSIMGLATGACGVSPLLNHTTAPDTVDSQASEVPEENGDGTSNGNPTDEAKDGAAKPSPTPTPSPKADCPLELKKSELCARIEWDHVPTTEDDSPFTLYFWDPKSGNSLTGPFQEPELAVTAKLWMPSMGHGAGAVKVAGKKKEDGSREPGQYRVTRVNFSMTGKWQVYVQLKDADKKVVDEAIENVTLNE